MLYVNYATILKVSHKKQFLLYVYFLINGCINQIVKKKERYEGHVTLIPWYLQQMPVVLTFLLLQINFIFQTEKQIKEDKQCLSEFLRVIIFHRSNQNKRLLFQAGPRLNSFLCQVFSLLYWDSYPSLMPRPTGEEKSLS